MNAIIIILIILVVLIILAGAAVLIWYFAFRKTGSTGPTGVGGFTNLIPSGQTGITPIGPTGQTGNGPIGPTGVGPVGPTGPTGPVCNPPVISLSEVVGRALGTQTVLQYAYNNQTLPGLISYKLELSKNGFTSGQPNVATVIPSDAVLSCNPSVCVLSVAGAEFNPPYTDVTFTNTTARISVNQLCGTGAPSNIVGVQEL